jgi:hypothetical protein
MKQGLLAAVLFSLAPTGAWAAGPAVDTPPAGREGRPATREARPAVRGPRVRPTTDPGRASAPGLATGPGQAAPARPSRALPALGITADVGVPDGLIAALTVRPSSWIRLHAGAGTNTAAPAVRGGVTLSPFGVGPTLSLEVGHAGPGNVNDLLRTFFGVQPSVAALFERMSYTYGNAHLGLEFGRKWFTFFLRGGLSYTRATLMEADDALQAQSDPSRRTTVTLYRDPILRATIPSAKLGFVVYLQ